MQTRRNSSDSYAAFDAARRSIANRPWIPADAPELRALHDHFFGMFQVSQSGAKSPTWLGRRYGAHETKQQAGQVRTDWVATADAGAKGGLDPAGVRARAFEHVIQAFIAYLRALGKVGVGSLNSLAVGADITADVQEAVRQMMQYASSGPPESATIGIDQVPDMYEEFETVINGLAANTLRFRDPLPGARTLILGEDMTPQIFSRRLTEAQTSGTLDRQQAAREVRYDKDRIRREQLQARKEVPGRQRARETARTAAIADLSSVQGGAEGSDTGGFYLDMSDFFTKSNPRPYSRRSLRGRY